MVNANKLCIVLYELNSLPTKCHLLVAFANILDPIRPDVCVGPNLGPNCLQS